MIIQAIFLKEHSGNCSNNWERKIESQEYQWEELVIIQVENNKKLKLYSGKEEK